MSTVDGLIIYLITMIVSIICAETFLAKITNWRLVSKSLASVATGSIFSYVTLALYGAIFTSADSDWLHSHLKGGSIMVIFGVGLILLVIIFEVILSKVLKKGKDSDRA
jgi:hypothetical protein